MIKLQAKSKLVQSQVTNLPEQFQQGALTAFIIAISLGCVYLIALVYTSPTSIYYIKGEYFINLMFNNSNVQASRRQR